MRGFAKSKRFHSSSLFQCISDSEFIWLVEQSKSHKNDQTTQYLFFVDFMIFFLKFLFWIDAYRFGTLISSIDRESDTMYSKKVSTQFLWVADRIVV